MNASNTEGKGDDINTHCLQQKVETVKKLFLIIFLNNYHFIKVYFN